MEVERYEDPVAAKDGSGESESDSKRRRRSVVKNRFSDRMMKELADKISFPNLSQDLVKQIKLSSFFSVLGDISCRPDQHATSKENEVGLYFDREHPIYSESFPHIPNVEEGKQLNVSYLLGDKLLSFIQNVHSFDPTKFRSYDGSCDDLNVGFKPSECSHDAQRILPLESSTTPREEIANVESTLNLRGKYVMICCVFVPALWCSEDGNLVYHMAAASHELAGGRDDFVMVVVPMMREGFTDSLIAYQHFLSGFSCLAVPFEDSPRREYICSALGFDGRIKAVILDPCEEVLFHGNPSVFYTVGGAEHECFPFTPERRQICLVRDGALQDLSLNELLGLRDTDVLCNISKDARITVSELKQKFVGLYVCCNGHSLRTLQKVHGECKRKKYDLEIVAVCCPRFPAPSKMHEELMVDALATCKLLDWWFFPFNNTVSHRLLRMCEEKSGEEGFFIVDPIEKYVDPYGLPIIVDFGMDSYPFTRRSLVDKELQRKMGLRLSSLLLPWGYVCHKPPDGGGSSSIVEIPVAEALNNKTVLLYLYTEKQQDIAYKLARIMWYEKIIKRKKSNVEVVAVNIDRSGASDECFMEKCCFMENWCFMGKWCIWFVCPADPTNSAKLRDEYFHPRCREGHEVLVAFGEDGRIQSLDASQFLECGVLPFHGNLREEIGREFYEAGFDYMLHYNYTV